MKGTGFVASMFVNNITETNLKKGLEIESRVTGDHFVRITRVDTRSLSHSLQFSWGRSMARQWHSTLHIDLSLRITRRGQICTIRPRPSPCARVCLADRVKYVRYLYESSIKRFYRTWSAHSGRCVHRRLFNARLPVIPR